MKTELPESAVAYLASIRGKAVRYSGEAFDRKQHLAYLIAEHERAKGVYSGAGYSATAWRLAEASLAGV